MLNYEIVREGNESKIIVGEKLTVTDVSEMQSALKSEISDGVQRIVFDLSGTIMLDSSGIGLLIATYNTLAKAQGKIRLINVSLDILKLLQNMRLADRLKAVAAQ